MLTKHKEQSSEREVYISSEAFTPIADQIELLVDVLVDHYQNASWKIQDREIIVKLYKHDLDLYESWLAKAHSYFRGISKHNFTQSIAAEWLLDNYYIIRRDFQQIRVGLPPIYARQLPKLTNGPLKGFPRIYAIARSILSYQQYFLNLPDLELILIQLQERVRLSMGELWALPIFLRYGCIEILAHALENVVQPQESVHLPVLPPQAVEVTKLNKINQSPADDQCVANAILSLRLISEQNWNDFFESVSRLESLLQKDPSGIYSQMDFKTRDLYRKEIESLSFATGHEEVELAEIIIDLACKASRTTSKSGPKQPDNILDEPGEHIGEYLLGNKRAELERRIDYQPVLKTTIKRWMRRQASKLYLGSILALTTSIYLFLIWMINPPALLEIAPPLQMIILSAVGLVFLAPVLTAGTSLANWAVTLLIRPFTLPKLNFKLEIPACFQTLIVIPALITDREEIDSLVSQLEMHYLRNPEPGLLFALLTDFRDADSETQAGDDDLLNYAAAAIENLNLKYGHSATGAGKNDSLFYLLHRKRLWNPAERKWMGWERKRGKLHELNLLLRGRTDLSFSKITTDMRGLELLKRTRFVVTLDADTILPSGAACRLAGTLAHPLNRAKFNEITGQIISGYSVLQPRMEIHPRSANISWFTRFYAGDSGLDLYTLAVSDAYQDLFGEGSYVGKGIYDVDAFERSVAGRIPENTVLSHDLLEGIMGRAGLVTDITMIEDYPPGYFVQIMRQRRWVRGDWQLLPWLVNPRKFRVVFSGIDRWKIFDNLLRSLLSPALVLAFASGMLFVPELASVWLALVMIFMGIPLITSLTGSVFQILRGERPGSALRVLGPNLMRWLLAIVFLPYEAYVNLDAIFTTLYRLGFSHRNLLQWTTAAQTIQQFGLRAHRNAAWLKMTISLVFSLSLAAGIQFNDPDSGVAPALIYAAPILLLWLWAPLVAKWISQPVKVKKVVLNEDSEFILRQVARRTWNFFERFVGPEDHWLPPDHFQESPVGIVAHHTSPTNIGLLFTSTLAAYDFGYLEQLEIATRLSTCLDTLGQLERFHGHFLNWYDTQTLKPLQPRYISTVDSGNLAAGLIVITQACRSLPDDPVFRWSLWQVYLDTLLNLSEMLAGLRGVGFDQHIHEIDQYLSVMRSKILAARNETGQWYALFQIVNGPFQDGLSSRLMRLVQAGDSVFEIETLHKLREITMEIERFHRVVQRSLAELLPWVALLEQPPALFTERQFVQVFNLLRVNLPSNPPLNQIPAYARKGLSNISSLRQFLGTNQWLPFLETEAGQKTLDWLNVLEQALHRASLKATLLMDRFFDIATRAEQYVNEMDFQYLYHTQRRVFHIGFNLETGQLDNSYYDLLASEARTASIIAIAKREIPQSHWLQLGRPLTRVDGRYVLLSWSATMFEYLMPQLFLRSYPDTLMTVSVQGAILHQVAYAKTQHIPWGISESGFYHFDADQNYQYRAFGVPGLGFKRSLADDLVVAPYASLMAIQYAPQALAQNLIALRECGCFGQYGLYESIDFTHSRLTAGETSMVIHEYMTHHQGMILMALANYFYNDIMVQRMHSDPRIQTIELLLQEKIPYSAPLQNLDLDQIKVTQHLKAGPAEITPWAVPVQTPIPQVNLLSNGEYSILLSNMGAGYSAWRNVDLTHWQPDGVLDPWGSWIYIQDLEHDSGEADSGDIWSAAFQPIPGRAENFEVNYFAHMAVFRRVEHGITSTLEITVHPDASLEVRRIHLQNTGSQTRRLRLTSYGEVVLSPKVVDNRNSVFNKQFVESEFVPELDLQIFKRSAHSNKETTIYMGHMLVVKNEAGLSDRGAAIYHETDRSCFVGRGSTLRRPNALVSEQALLEGSDETFDPIFALGQVYEIQPLESVELAYLTFAGDDREALITLGKRYRNWDLIERSFHQADIAIRHWLGQEDFKTFSLKNSLQILSGLLYPFKALRASPAVIAANQLSQPRLFQLGISGDNPILVVELDAPDQIELVREVLQVHRFLQNRRFSVDVVILNRQQTDSGAELDEMLRELLRELNYEQELNQPAGIFIFFDDQISTVERTLLQTAARVLFTGKRGSLNDQMPLYPLRVYHLPEFIPTQSVDDVSKSLDDEPLHDTAPIQFFNGYGGFSRDGREYIVDLPQGKANPIPLINVIDYPNIGFMVSETGSQSTWSINRTNRLTTWSDDPVCDPSSEALYLRDEETGEVWTPTPQPAGADRPYRVSHGAGYTLFEHNSHGLRQRLTLFASPDDPVKIILLKVENSLKRTRRITATQYVEWVLGTTHSETMQYLVPEYDAAEACLLVSNPNNAKFSERVAFLFASKALHGLTADRTEFFGRGGTPAFPAALDRIGLETRITPGDDPCAVLQLHLDLLPGGIEEIYFVLGQAENKSQALAMARKYHQPGNVSAALKSTHTFWDRLLCGLCYPTSEDNPDELLEHQSLDTLSEPLLLRPGPVGLLSAQRGAFDIAQRITDEMVTQSHIDQANANNTPDQIFKVIQPSFGDEVRDSRMPEKGTGLREEEIEP